MRNFLLQQLRPAILVLVVMTVITGMAYPAAVTAVAQVVFPSQANGSFITTTDAIGRRSGLRRHVIGRLQPRPHQSGSARPHHQGRGGLPGRQRQHRSRAD